MVAEPERRSVFVDLKLMKATSVFFVFPVWLLCTSSEYITGQGWTRLVKAVTLVYMYLYELDFVEPRGFHQLKTPTLNLGARIEQHMSRPDGLQFY